MQETHLSDREHDKLSKTWADNVYFSSHTSGRKRGVAILVKRGLNFTYISHYTDSEGRYILLNGTIDGIRISLCNIYAPNEDDPIFIKKIFGLIIDKSDGIVIAGGDMNCVMSQLKDRTPMSASTSGIKMGKALNHHCQEMGLIDIWRYKHPNSQDFTFYSNRYSSYSRIDLLFTPREEAHRITDCKILPITLSDHSPVVVQWCLGQTKGSKNWRLNTSLLNDPTFVQFVKTELNNYLELNTHPETSPLILWDCAKAYLRGRIIAFSSAKKKEKESERKRLESKIELLSNNIKLRTPKTF